MKIVLSLLLAVIVLYVGLTIFGWWALWHGSKAMPITQRETDNMVAKLEAIQVLADQVRQHGFRVDDSSVGYPDEEQDLLALNIRVRFYARQFDRLPNDLGEIVKPPLDNQIPSERRRLQRLAKACEMIRLRQQAYVLTCDKSLPADPVVLNRLIADRDTEKFYLADKSVMLYVPNY